MLLLGNSTTCVLVIFHGCMPCYIAAMGHDGDQNNMIRHSGILNHIDMMSLISVVL